MICVCRFGFSPRGLLSSRSLQRWAACTMLAASLCLAAGCGQPKGPTRYAVSGNVTREGKPMAEGTIQMVPTGGGAAASAQILDGKFQFTRENGPIAGKQAVTITRMLARAEVPPGTPKKDADTIPETGFNKPMPAAGWLLETTVEKDHDVSKPLEFNVDNASAAGPAPRRQKS